MARWPLKDVASPTHIAYGGGAIWVTVAAAPDAGAGHLIKIDGQRGTVLGSWPIGADPEAVAATDQRVWVADGAAPGSRDPNETIEFDLDGNRVHTYATVNPSGIVANAAEAWVSTYQSDTASIAHLSDGRVQSSVTLPGASYGRTNVIGCSDGVYGTTIDTNTTRILISKVTDGGRLQSVGSVPGQQSFGLACVRTGVIVAAGADHASISGLPTNGGPPTTVDLPSQKSRVFAAADAVWLLYDASQNDHSSLSLVNGGSLQRGPTLDIDADVIDAAAVGERLWAVTDNSAGAAVIELS